MNAKTTTAACIVALTLSSSAWAGPEYTEEELFEMAEAVADVEVISTDCGQVTSYDYGIVTHYSSMVRTIEVLKGELPAEFDYRSHTTAYVEGGEAGCSEAELPVGQGWIGRAYLKSVGTDIYYVVDWGGMVSDQAQSAPQPLPVCEEPTPPEPTDPSDPTNPTEPSNPSDPTQTSQSSTQAAGCSAGGNASTTGGLLVALALALGLGVRRRRP